MPTTTLGRLDIIQWIGDTGLWEEMSGGTISDEIAGMPGGDRTA